MLLFVSVLKSLCVRVCVCVCQQVEVAAKLAKEEELYQKQLEAQAEEKKV